MYVDKVESIIAAARVVWLRDMAEDSDSLGACQVILSLRWRLVNAVLEALSQWYRDASALIDWLNHHIPMLLCE